MILFLDDCPRRTKAFRSCFPSAKCVKTAQEAIEELKNATGEVSLFLDHDLGGETYVSSERPDTGMEVVRWIEKNKPKLSQVTVHTCNFTAGLAMTDGLRKMGYEVQNLPFPVLIGILEG